MNRVKISAMRSTPGYTLWLRDAPSGKRFDILQRGDDGTISTVITTRGVSDADAVKKAIPLVGQAEARAWAEDLLRIIEGRDAQAENADDE